MAAIPLHGAEVASPARGCYLLPVKPVMQWLGGTISQQGSTTFILQLGEQSVTYTIGSTQLQTPSGSQDLPAAPAFGRDRGMAPLEVFQALGVKSERQENKLCLEWNDKKGFVSLPAQGQSKPLPPD